MRRHSQPRLRGDKAARRVVGGKVLSRLSANHCGRSCEGNRRLAVMPEPDGVQFNTKRARSSSPASRCTIPALRPFKHPSRPDVASCPGEGEGGRPGAGRQRWAVRLTFWVVAGAAVSVWYADEGGRGAESAAGPDLEWSASGQNFRRLKFLQSSRPALAGGRAESIFPIGCSVRQSPKSSAGSRRPTGKW